MFAAVGTPAKNPESTADSTTVEARVRRLSWIYFTFGQGACAPANHALCREATHRVPFFAGSPSSRITPVENDRVDPSTAEEGRGGGGGSRTRVRKRSARGVYMLSCFDGA